MEPELSSGAMSTRAPSSRRQRGRRIPAQTWSPVGHALTGRRYRSADLTHWIVLRGDAPANEPSHVNVFSVLVLREAAVDSASWAFTNPKGSPETIPGTPHKLMCGVASMPVEDVDRLLTFDPSESTFVVPAVEAKYGRKPVLCPGAWLRPRIVASGDFPDRDLLPSLPATVWVAELDPQPAGLPAIVGEKGLEWLVRHLHERLGVNLAHQPDRLGTFLVAWPDNRLDVQAVRASSGRKVGLRLLASGVELSAISVTICGKRAGSLVNAVTVSRPRAWQVVDLAADFDDFDVLAFHEDGTLLFADAVRPLRSVILSGTSADAPVMMPVQPTSATGEPVGSVAAVDIRSGIPIDTAVSDVAPWEHRRRRARRVAAQAALIEQGRLRVYRGSAEERREALDHLRALVAAHHKGPLRIWDDYFGGEDLLELVGAFSRSQVPVRILTGESRPPGEQAAVRPSLDDVVRGLQAAARAAGARFDIQHRGGQGFHDRFLITDRTCWQLGSSFNSIGAKFSTIVEFPNLDTIRDEFDRRWDAWRPAVAGAGREL